MEAADARRRKKEELLLAMKLLTQVNQSPEVTPPHSAGLSWVDSVASAYRQTCETLLAISKSNNELILAYMDSSNKEAS
jgi:hypothetical protein